MHQSLAAATEHVRARAGHQLITLHLSPIAGIMLVTIAVLGTHHHFSKSEISMQLSTVQDAHHLAPIVD
jgi:hypothetical protein